MRIIKTDVLAKRERTGKVVYWVSQECLLGNLDGLTEEYFRTKARLRYSETVSPAKRKKDVMPDTGHAWRFATFNGRFYYDLERIPNHEPARYRSKLPASGEQLLQMARECDLKGFCEAIKTTMAEAISTHAADYKDSYRTYRYEHAQALAVACAALKCVVDGAADARESIRYYQAVSAALESLGVAYLPRHPRRLREKVEAVWAGQPVTEVVDLPRKGNQYALKLNDPEVESWIIQMRGMPQNYTNAWIIRKVQWMCELTGKRAPSDSWVSQLLASPKVKFVSSAGRYGERGRKGGIYRGYTPIANALYAGDAWQADGTRVNFIPWTNPKTGRQEFLYMIVIRDVHSGCVLGGYFGLVENQEAYIDALVHAIRYAGYLPYELVLDRFPGHNGERWKLVQHRLEMMGVRVSYKHTAQGKAQVERWFETLQSVFFQDCPYYYGEGIQSNRPAARRSAEYIKAVSKEAKGLGYGADVAIREAEKCILTYNKTPLCDYSRQHKQVAQSPEVLHAESEKPHVCSVQPDMLALALGISKSIQIRNGLVHTQIGGVPYVYELPAHVVMNYNAITVACMPDALETAYLFAGDSPLDLRPVGEGKVISRVQVYGPDADWGALQRDKARRKEIAAAAQAERQRLVDAGSDVSLYLDGLASKEETESAESALLMRTVLNDPPTGGTPVGRAQDIDGETEDQTPEINVREWMLKQW